MKTYKFKTSLKCSGCVQSLTPHINAIEGVHSWHVDLNSADKITVVECADAVTSGEIIEGFEKAGFKAELV